MDAAPARYCLTRRFGESLRLTGPDGQVILVTVSHDDKHPSRVRLLINGPGGWTATREEDLQAWPSVPTL